MSQKKPLIFVAFLLFTVIVGTFYFFRCDTVCLADNMREETQNFSHISPEDFNKQLPGATIIDVRTPEEYVTGHIVGAMLVDFSADDFKARIGQFNRDLPYYVYCRSSNRSKEVLSIMKTAGFKQVFGLDGGISAWREIGFDVE